MNELQSTLIMQILSYAALMLATVGLIGILLKGFFFKYIKVRSSFGALIMVKIRTPLRDFYSIGNIAERQIHYNKKNPVDNKKVPVHITIPEGVNPFYRSLGITWVDIDEDKNAIGLHDYKTASGHDVIKESELLKRALERPSISDKTMKIVIVLVALCLVLSIIAAVLGYQNSQNILWLKANIPELIKGAKGTIQAAAI